MQCLAGTDLSASPGGCRFSFSRVELHLKLIQNMFLGVLNISSNILDGSLAPKVSYEHFLMKNLPKIDSEEI